MKGLVTKRVQEGTLLKGETSYVLPKNATSRVQEISTPSTRPMCVLGFGPLIISGRQEANMVSQPLESFFPDRLVIPSNIAADFLIVDFKVGRNSQFLSAVPVPALVFSESATAIRLKLDICHVGFGIAIHVRNQSPGPREFSCVVIGPPL